MVGAGRRESIGLVSIMIDGLIPLITILVPFLIMWLMLISRGFTPISVIEHDLSAICLKTLITVHGTAMSFNLAILIFTYRFLIDKNKVLADSILWKFVIALFFEIIFILFGVTLLITLPQAPGGSLALELMAFTSMLAYSFLFPVITLLRVRGEISKK